MTCDKAFPKMGLKPTSLNMCLQSMCGRTEKALGKNVETTFGHKRYGDMFCALESKNKKVDWVSNTGGPPILQGWGKTRDLTIYFSTHTTLSEH